MCPQKGAPAVPWIGEPGLRVGHQCLRGRNRQREKPACFGSQGQGTRGLAGSPLPLRTQVLRLRVGSPQRVSRDPLLGGAQGWH